MLPLKVFEILHTVMGILALFEQFVTQILFFCPLLVLHQIYCIVFAHFRFMRGQRSVCTKCDFYPICCPTKFYPFFYVRSWWKYLPHNSKPQQQERIQKVLVVECNFELG